MVDEEYEEVSRTIIRYYSTYITPVNSNGNVPTLILKVIHLVWALLLFVWSSLSLAYAFTVICDWPSKTQRRLLVYSYNDNE